MKLKSILSALLFALSVNLGAMDEKQLQKELAEKMAQLNQSMQEQQEKLNKVLLQAIEKNNVKQAKKLINSGANVNTLHFPGQTLLYITVCYGHTACAKLLIENDADLNQAPTKGNWAGETPLYAAASYGRTDIAKLLIEKDAKINQDNENGETPLYRAAHNGHTDIAKLLIENGANLNQAPTKGRWAGKTPLYRALSNHNNTATAIVFLLLNNGAKIDNQTLPRLNKKGFDPLQIAIAQSNTEQIDSLLGDKLVDKTHLENPIKYNNVEMVVFLLKKIHNINVLNKCLSSTSTLINNIIKFRKNQALYFDMCNQKRDICIIKLKNKELSKEEKATLRIKLAELEEIRSELELQFDRYVAQQMLKYGTTSKDRYEQRSSIQALFFGPIACQNAMINQINHMLEQKEKEKPLQNKFAENLSNK